MNPWNSLHRFRNLSYFITRECVPSTDLTIKAHNNNLLSMADIIRFGVGRSYCIWVYLSSLLFPVTSNRHENFNLGQNCPNSLWWSRPYQTQKQLLSLRYNLSSPAFLIMDNRDKVRKILDPASPGSIFMSSEQFPIWILLDLFRGGLVGLKEASVFHRYK